MNNRSDPDGVLFLRWKNPAIGQRKGTRMRTHITLPIPMFDRIRAEALARGISLNAVIVEMLQAAEGLSEE